MRWQSHLLQAHTRPLDQCLQSGDCLILPQQVGVEGRGQVAVALVRDHIDGSEARVLGLAVAGVNVSLRRHAEGHEHLWDLLNELELVGKLGQLLWQFNEVVIDVHKTQVSLEGNKQHKKHKKHWALCIANAQKIDLTISATSPTSLPVPMLTGLSSPNNTITKHLFLCPFRFDSSTSWLAGQVWQPIKCLSVHKMGSRQNCT